MKKNAFRLPMTKTEAIVGWVYVFVHIFAMPYILSAFNYYVLPSIGLYMKNDALNVAYYAVGFVFLLCFLFHFLRESFSDMCGNFANTLFAVLIGYVVYVLLSNLVALFLEQFLSDLTNPNDASVQTVAKLNPNSMLVTGVLLAPVVEETLFRGVVFGTIRRRNAILAYAVSTVLFAVYHLWQYMVFSFTPSLLLYLLQYLPAGLVLGWCYEHGRSIWAPVFLHMIINYVSITVTIG